MLVSSRRAVAALVLAAATVAGGAQAATAQTAPAQPEQTLPSPGEQARNQARYETLRVTTGQAATQNPALGFPPYTAAVDENVTRLADARAAQIANGAPFTPGIQTTNTIPTGWAHQREVIGRGAVGYKVTPHYYDDLYGPSNDDPRNVLMTGPKTVTAVGTAVEPSTGHVVVVVVNGYASEPTVGPVVPAVPLPSAADAAKALVAFS